MILEALEASMKKIAEGRLRDTAQKKYVVMVVMEMFNQLGKKQVPDLAERVQRMQKQVEHMVENLSLQFVRGELVVKVTGSSESLIKAFRFGSDWFLPEPDVDKIIMSAILTDPKRS